MSEARRRQRRPISGRIVRSTDGLTARVLAEPKIKGACPCLRYILPSNPEAGLYCTEIGSQIALENFDLQNKCASSEDCQSCNLYPKRSIEKFKSYGPITQTV
ncbi:hypothetical protein KY335_03115 [Candidatus Woesearchaeota archaeon]|nr:hypothetical protein [Candidatus Woesearchaeota archaeon]